MIMKLLNLIASTTKLSRSDIPNLPTASASSILTDVLNAIYFIVGFFAVIIIILAGFTFITANGDPAKITKARMAILYSVIGLIVVMFAFTITAFITGRF
jgi:hypothetical protein